MTLLEKHMETYKHLVKTLVADYYAGWFTFEDLTRALEDAGEDFMKYAKLAVKIDMEVRA